MDKKRFIHKKVWLILVAAIMLTSGVSFYFLISTLTSSDLAVIGGIAFMVIIWKVMVVFRKYDDFDRNWIDRNREII